MPAYEVEASEVPGNKMLALIEQSFGKPADLKRDFTYIQQKTLRKKRGFDAVF